MESRVVHNLKAGAFVNRFPVASSNIKSVGYDAVTRTLEIEFEGGSVYQYFEVPEHVFTGLKTATSPGTFFDSNVKKVGYRLKRIS